MRVSMTELKSHLAQYVRHAQSGVVVEVTSHQRVVARLTGVTATDGTAASRLIQQVWQLGRAASRAAQR